MNHEMVLQILQNRSKCGKVLAERFKSVEHGQLNRVSLALERIASEVDKLREMSEDPAWFEDSREATARQRLLVHEASLIEAKAVKADARLMKTMDDPNLFYERWA